MLHTPLSFAYTPYNISLHFQPTVKFYGDIEQRHINILENEPARLPLRLTGDGVSPRLETLHIL